MRSSHRPSRHAARAVRSHRVEALERRCLLSASQSQLEAPAALAALADDVGSAGSSAADIDLIQSMSIAANTGEKPQSKVWTHGGKWWSVLSTSSGAGVWRLDGAQWTNVLPLTSGKYYADVRSVGDVAHILLYNGASSKLASVEFVPGGLGSYRLWTQRSTLTNVSYSSGVETATIDIDSTGRMWTASDANSTIEVRYSDAPYTSFSAPITLATGVSSDDISMVTAMPGGKIAVMWSNQTTRRFGFKVHQDGASPTTWSIDEVPGGALARNKDGGGMADDHMHVAVASDGTLYAVVKTSYDSVGATSLGLLVRRPNGQWDNAFYHIDIEGTRPTIALNEAIGKLFVFFRSDFNGLPIVYKESSLASISFGSTEMTLVGGNDINDASTTKQNFTGELVVIASNSRTLYGAVFTPAGSGGGASNAPPIVSAGPDQTIALGSPAVLDAAVSDDGKPAPPGAVSVQWSKVSGLGAVAFADSHAVDTTATFSAPGAYVLRLAASDSQLQASDEISVLVVDASAHESLAFQDGVAPTAQYVGTRDTYLNAKKANNNFGVATTLLADGVPDEAMLFRWDLSAIPPGSIVESVSLTLNVTDRSPQNYEVYELLRDWNESQATWNQAAVGVPWSTAGAQAALDRGTTTLGGLSAVQSGLNTFALNSEGVAAVQRWIDAPSSNFGLIVEDYLSNTDSLGISSSENSNKPKRPMITIGYRHAAAPAGGGANLAALADAGDDAPTDTRRRIRIAGRHPSARDFVFSQLGRGA